MSDHRVLDFDTPIEPGDITVGNVVVLYGEPRTIQSVKPMAALPSRLPSLAPQLVADLGNGHSQVFYVLTCHTCHGIRTFPGLQGMESWYGLAHDGSYRIYCTTECLTKGLHE